MVGAAQALRRAAAPARARVVHDWERSLPSHVLRHPNRDRAARPFRGGAGRWLPTARSLRPSRSARSPIWRGATRNSRPGTCSSATGALPRAAASRDRAVARRIGRSWRSWPVAPAPDGRGRASCRPPRCGARIANRVTGLSPPYPRRPRARPLPGTRDDGAERRAGGEPAVGPGACLALAQLAAQALRHVGVPARPARCPPRRTSHARATLLRNRAPDILLRDTGGPPGPAVGRVAASTDSTGVRTVYRAPGSTSPANVPRARAPSTTTGRTRARRNGAPRHPRRGHGIPQRVPARAIPPRGRFQHAYARAA